MSCFTFTFSVEIMWRQEFFEFIIIIFSTFISDQYPATCYRECRCYVNPQERALVADCAHAGLIQIPKSLPRDTDWLILSGNNITSVQVVDLQFVLNLSRLVLNNNKTKYISEDFVQYLKTQSDLVDLDISNNELKSIPRNFESVKILKTLMISGNNFECNCNNFWMKNWIMDNRETIQDYKRVYCEMES